MRSKAALGLFILVILSIFLFVESDNEAVRAGDLNLSVGHLQGKFFTTLSLGYISGK